jgi:predicted Rossmann fold flavoprotein
MGWKSNKLVHRYEIVIIGAGASGLMAASRFKDRKIAIIDSNPKIAQKIKISGGGRCNITNENVTADNYLGERDFIKKVLNSFNQHDLLIFLKDRGCEPVIQKENQYFCKNSSSEIIDILYKEIKNSTLFLNQKVISVTKDDYFHIKTDKDEFSAKKLIVASGGLSYPKIGASSIAYEIAESFGHTIKSTSPALVGFTLQKDQFWMKELSGISLPVKIKVADKEFVSYLLFAHKGISGPAVLNASLYWYKGSLEIDFLPDDKLKKYLKNSRKLLSSALPLPKRFLKLFFESIALEDKRVDQLNESDKQKLSLLKSYTFAPAGNFGYQKAEVTRGGISTDEIDPDTMMSRVVKDLYFTGECLDVTGELGGYNFQWAFSSAMKITL